MVDQPRAEQKGGTARGNQPREGETWGGKLGGQPGGTSNGGDWAKLPSEFLERGFLGEFLSEF